MEILVGILIGVIITYISVKIFGINENSELINELSERRKENTILKESLDNAELRTTEFARKIKSIEDILINSEKDKENFFITISKIKRELADLPKSN